MKILAFMLIFNVFSICVLTQVQPASSAWTCSGTVYVRADGSVDPPPDKKALCQKAVMEITARIELAIKNYNYAPPIEATTSCLGELLKCL